MIASTTRDQTCCKRGNKKELFRCCTFGCNIFLCKTCIDQRNQDSPNYVSANADQGSNEDDKNINSSGEDHADDNNNSDDDGHENEYKFNNDEGTERDDESFFSNMSDEVRSSVNTNVLEEDRSSVNSQDSFGDNFGSFLTTTDDVNLICVVMTMIFLQITNLCQLQILEKGLFLS